MAWEQHQKCLRFFWKELSGRATSTAAIKTRHGGGSALAARRAIPLAVGEPAIFPSCPPRKRQDPQNLLVGADHGQSISICADDCSRAFPE